MPDSRRNRERRSGRRSPFIEPKPLILVVCEGAVTEKEYLKGFANWFRNQQISIKPFEIAEEFGRASLSLVREAKRLKQAAENKADGEGDPNLRYDSVWCVFDVDDHPDIPNAREMARDNGIELAISNPCIELWLLLHFRGNPGMQHRDRVREMLTTFVPGYDKHVDFKKDYAPGYEQAVSYAKTLDQLAERDGEDGRNPTTGVYRLTSLIRGE